MDSIYLVDMLNSRLYMERIQGSTVKEILRASRQGGKFFEEWVDDSTYLHIVPVMFINCIQCLRNLFHDDWTFQMI